MAIHMTSSEFKSAIQEWYQGEIFGEVFFNELLANTVELRLCYKLSLLLQLETETKARLRPVVVAEGLSLCEKAEFRSAANEAAAAFRDMTWMQTMTQIVKIVVPAVARYQAIVEMSPEQYAVLSGSMLLHEQAILDFAILELAGNQDEAEALILNLLYYKF